MPDGVAGHPLADLRDIVLDHLPAGLVLLLFGKALHPLHILGGVRREGAGLQLDIVRRDLQPGGVAGDDVLPVIGGFEVDIDRQDLQNLDEAVVPGHHYAAPDILDGKPRLDAVPVGPASPGSFHSAAENQFFYVHFFVHSPR